MEHETVQAILKFGTEKPFIFWSALWLLWLPYFAGVVVLGVVKSLAIRSLRAVMVALRGWPPAHLDADGDWKPEARPAKESA